MGREKDLDEMTEEEKLEEEIENLEDEWYKEEPGSRDNWEQGSD